MLCFPTNDPAEAKHILSCWRLNLQLPRKVSDSRRFAVWLAVKKQISKGKHCPAFNEEICRCKFVSIIRACICFDMNLYICFYINKIRNM